MGAMSFSLSHKKAQDVGHFGLPQEDLPVTPTGAPAGPIDLRAWFLPNCQLPISNLEESSPGLSSSNRQSAIGNRQSQLPSAPGVNPPARPLELEIGSGKGTFLVQQATLLPGVNFIGVEWARAFWMFAADRCRRRGLENVRVVRAEAGLFVRCYVPDGCLRQVHVYFPDPWPKKRHHKRRLIQAPFLRELARTLEPGGLVRLATDHEDYHQWMLDHAGQVLDILAREPFVNPESAGEGELVGTNFERKYRREGRPFFAFALRKRV
jgi:tRNA (guanine-N7-)-methyltransferase